MVFCAEGCLNILVIAITRDAKSNHVEETALSPLNESSCKKKLVTTAEQNRALLVLTFRLTTLRYAESDAIVCVITGNCWTLTNCISVSDDDDDDDDARSCNNVVILSGNPINVAVQDCRRVAWPDYFFHK